ncbi:Minichromosome maintenance protein MCM [uncultured archaeon]|nr:Minichromosome maintenance protein MCM [uncultured archaeon]
MSFEEKEFDDFASEIGEDSESESPESTPASKSSYSSKGKESFNEISGMGKESGIDKLKSEDLMIEAKKFFDFYKKELGKSIRKGSNVVYLDFIKLTEFSNNLPEGILSNPEDTLRLIEVAIEESGLIKNVRIRLVNIPKSQEIKVRNIRSKNLNEMIVIEGIIRQASDVRPQVVNAKFECPSCGTVMSVLQIEKKFREPPRCSCGRRGGFKLLSKEMVDTQRLVVEEAPESLSGGEQPKRINVFVKEDLVEPKMEEKTTPGSRIKVIGILKEVPIPLQTGGLSTRFELAIEANNVIPLEETFEELDISEEDERQILELSEDPMVFENLARSITPSIWGYEEIKKSLVLQLFSGVQKVHKDGQKSRGDIHILLIGDPGVAKSVTLGFMANISPKGRYVVGKSASGAGLTATVVRDEYLRGWSLEAGAMVLANKGLVCVDELEKMDPNDRSAMHEAMEQQCMMPDFKLMLSNGKEVEIGKFVDSLIEKNEEKVYSGKNCEILPVDNVELISTNFQNQFPLKADRVSRHIAPKEFIKIILANGREITVTPEHPCWVVKDGKITTIPAEKLKQGVFFPIPSEIKINTLNYKKENDLLCKIIGYHLSDGCYELNRGRKTGIQFCNNNERLIQDYKLAVEQYFKVKPIITKRGNLFSVRVISKKVAEEMLRLDSSLLEKGKIRKIPEALMQMPEESIKYLLMALYDGDGSVSNQQRNGCRISFVSENRELEEQMTCLLLRFGIQSSIFKDNHSKVWRLDISGQENLSKFLLNINFLSSHKKQKLREYAEKEKTYKTIRDVIPNCTDKISEIFKKLNISAKKEIGHQIDLGVEKQRLFLQKLVNIAMKKAVQSDSKESQEIIKELKELERLAFGYARWVKIKDISIIKNENIRWVYDVTVEPYHTFVSNGMILHNTITISKANVQATLRAETSVLAAANPKFGRFDPSQPIAQQIDLPPTLINRFDIIFTLRDIPDRRKDEMIAEHVLNEHKMEGEGMFVPRDLFRKYVAYAKQRIKPELSDEAIKEIKEFYVDLRNQPIASEGGLRPIPISARQLQALIRMSEACAKMRLSKKVTREDAKKSIELMKYYLMQVGYDYESKTFDIDRISGRFSASQRGKILNVRDIIIDLENKLGKMIPLEEIENELEGKMSKEEIDEALAKLSNSGDIFSPRKGYISRTG